MAHKRSVRFLVLLVALASLAFDISGVAQENPSPSLPPKLPRPSGPFGVGRSAFDWIDATRAGDMAEDRGPHAELMVYVWYPTKPKTTEGAGVLFPGAREIDSTPGVPDYLRTKTFGGNWPLVVSGAITSHAEDNVSIVQSPRTLPVVIFSPGAFGTSFQYTSAIEDLASHGYVVASIEHTSEVGAVMFADRKVHLYRRREYRSKRSRRPEVRRKSTKPNLKTGIDTPWMSGRLT